MLLYHEHPAYKGLVRAYNSRVAGAIIRSGCTTLAEFCERHTEEQMLRQPRVGRDTLMLIKVWMGNEGLSFRDPSKERKAQPEFDFDPEFGVQEDDVLVLLNRIARALEQIAHEIAFRSL